MHSRTVTIPGNVLIDPITDDARLVSYEMDEDAA